MTFIEIMKEATPQQRGKVMAAIIADGVSASAAYAYCNGSRRPKYLYRVQIQKHVKKFLGWEVPLDELFPE